ncbi:lipoprotein [Xylophilus sp. GW821-FHT01B05]
MLKVPGILVRAFVLAGSAAVLAACGQKGPLMLPTGPLAAGRATLPQTVKRQVFGAPDKAAPAAAGATTDSSSTTEPSAPPPEQDLVPSMSFPAITTP